MEIFETFLLTLFDTVGILLLIHSIKKSLPFKLLNAILYIMITSISIGVINMFITDDVISHLLGTSISVFTLYCYLFINGFKKKVSCLLIYFVVILFLMILQLIGIVILNFIIGEVQYNFQNGLIAQSLNLIMVFIITKSIPISLLDTFIEDRNLRFNTLIATTFISYYGITILWYINIRDINNFILGLIVVVIFAITINAIILREGFISRIYKEKLSIYDTYFPIIDDMMEELRSKQHDYHNQIQTIIAMKRDEFTTEKDIEDYIEEMNRNNLWGDLLKLDDRIISAFLYSKLNEALKKDISIKITIRDFNLQSIFSTYQLVEMYGILIDNALEAVGALQRKNQNIELFIYRKDDMNVFEIRNDFSYISVAEINNFFSNGYTTKKGVNKGIGLYKLKKMVESKNGTIDFYYDTELAQVIAKLCHYYLRNDSGISGSPQKVKQAH